MYHYIYKISNTINGKIYVGRHSCKSLENPYMGSGSGIRSAIKKYGIENFTKEILFIYDNIEDLINKEAEIVNADFVKDTNTYNNAIGGDGYKSGFVPVKDENNNTIFISTKDPDYVSGKYNAITKGKVTARDKNNNVVWVDKDDPRLISGELHGNTKNKFAAFDKDGNSYFIDKQDPRFISGELHGNNLGMYAAKTKNGEIKFINCADKSDEFVGATKGQVTVRDADGKCFNVNVSDERYISGELQSIQKGKVHIRNKKDKNVIVVAVDDDRCCSDEWEYLSCGMVVVRDAAGNRYKVRKDDPRYLSGELYGLNKGKINVVEVATGKRTILYKDDPRILDGLFVTYNTRKIKTI